jgi:hypothetical protein
VIFENDLKKSLRSYQHRTLKPPFKLKSGFWVASGDQKAFSEVIFHFFTARFDWIQKLRLVLFLT